ncbi:MAG TPA: hypothetical protein EYP56_22800 [Planctomycetaceae bacterium]|nr:hypothetical protein [Planctomycetaceae bacterium]
MRPCFRDPTIQTGDTEVQAAVGSPVRLHHIPNWLRLLMIRRLKIPRELHSGWGVIMHAQSHGYMDGWLDHWGSTRRGNEIIFVSEPYGLTDAAVRNLDTFCRRLGVDYEISACSEWYPTFTLRVAILPPWRNL